MQMCTGQQLIKKISFSPHDAGGTILSSFGYFLTPLPHSRCLGLSLHWMSTWRPLTFGFAICPEWSDHEWTAQITPGIKWTCVYSDDCGGFKFPRSLCKYTPTSSEQTFFTKRKEMSIYNICRINKQALKIKNVCRQCFTKFKNFLLTHHVSKLSIF